MTLRSFVLFAAAIFWAGTAAAGRININTASAAELDELGGIGPARAQAIVDYRERHGPFRALRDLKKVPELPDGVVQGLKGKLSYTTAQRPAKGANAAGERRADRPAPGHAGKHEAAAPTAGEAGRHADKPATPSPVAPSGDGGEKVPAPAMPRPAQPPAIEAPRGGPAMPARPAAPHVEAVKPPAMPASPAAPAPARPAMPH